MEVEQWRSSAGGQAMTFDEVSMERSKSFVKALQELKNLKPQLYSAAEYCEKSYLHNEQKQVVLDNLKDYAVRALVNAVDHLGTVAYKLTDLVDKQKSDLSTVELRISCLGQQVATCQTYKDKESLSRQRLPAINRRYHKHYVLPNAVNKKVRINPQPTVYSDVGQNQSLMKSAHSTAAPGSKTLSWHLATESKSGSDEASNSQQSYHSSKASTSVAEVSLRDAVKATPTMPLAAHLQSTSEGSHPRPVLNGSGAKVEPLEFQNAASAFKSLGTPSRQEISRPAARSKSMFLALFTKNKPAKQKKGHVS